MRRSTIAWAVCTTLLALSAAAAGPRDGPELAGAIEVETPDLGEWMKRLQGRFVFDGVIYHVVYEDPPNGGPPRVVEEWSQPVAAGKADCVGFADGPGIQCALHVDWATGAEGILDSPGSPTGLTYAAPKTTVYYAPADSTGASNLKPGMILGGLAPSIPGTIRFLLVDDRGLAQPGALTLVGNAATAKPPCVNTPGAMVCERRFRIEARPEARILFVTFSVRSVSPARGGTGSTEAIFEYSFALRRELPDPDAGKP